MHSLLQLPAFLKIDWNSFLLGTEKWDFLGEVALRTFVMFFVILGSLRILGKRSITQLSIFELGVIIGLGSAAGDPMFYKDVGILAGMMVFFMVISLYRLVTLLINKSERLEKIFEGQPVYLVKEGRFDAKTFHKEPIARDEFFAQLRQHSVTHLGQVEQAIIETNGTISLFYFADDAVKWGLPVLPHLCEKILKTLPATGKYACSYCGRVDEVVSVQQQHVCASCGKKEWVKAINNRRIC